MKTPRARAENLLAKALVAIWLITAMGALVPMFRLWVTREWRMYAGLPAEKQRAALFKHIGWDAYLLEDAARIASNLPPDEDYRFVGDFNRLSYVTYLLIPRVPRGHSRTHIVDSGTSLTLQRPGADLPAARPAPGLFGHPARPAALLLAVLLVLGAAQPLRHLARGGLSFPQGVTLSLLSGMALTIASRAVFSDVGAGFALWAAAGASGLALTAWHLPRERHRFRDRPKRDAEIRWPLLAAATSASLYLLWSLLMAVVVVPDDWDAWAMWGAKAKVLALGAGPLEEVTRFGSGEYPLLWPALWAFTGWLAGGWEETWSKGWGAVLLLIALFQMPSHGSREGAGNRGAARLFGPALFCTMPCVALTASWGYAEPAYWLVLACSWSSLTRLRMQPSNAGAFIAGLMLTAALYTKNEGAVFAALACAWAFFEHGVTLRQKITLALVPAVLFSPWYIWTRQVLELGTTSTGGFLAIDALPQRLASSLVPVSVHVLTLWSDVRLWGAGGIVLGGAALFALARGSAVERRDLGLVALLFFAYLGTVLCGKNDPGWQIGAAWNRLSIHLLLLTTMILSPRLERIAAQACPGRTCAYPPPR